MIIGNEKRLGIMVDTRSKTNIFQTSFILTNAEVISFSMAGDHNTSNLASTGAKIFKSFVRTKQKITLELEIEEIVFPVGANEEEFKRQVFNVPKHIPDEQLTKYNKVKRSKK